jgi:hypothetical protein
LRLRLAPRQRRAWRPGARDANGFHTIRREEPRRAPPPVESAVKRDAYIIDKHTRHGRAAGQVRLCVALLLEEGHRGVKPLPVQPKIPVEGGPRPLKLPATDSIPAVGAETTPVAALPLTDLLPSDAPRISARSSAIWYSVSSSFRPLGRSVPLRRSARAPSTSTTPSSPICVLPFVWKLASSKVRAAN